MSKEQIISKGKYTRTQPEGMVGVKQYLFVRDGDGKKRLLLRFENSCGEKCSKYAFILYRLDAKGNILGQERYESADREILPNEVFSFERQIEVEEKCSDFKVQMVYARYGSYTYNVEHENVSVAYSENSGASSVSARDASKVKPRRIQTRRFDMPWIFGIISIILLSLVVFVSGYLLNGFMEREVDFTLSGVSYRFVDEEKKGDVIITGCADTYRQITLTGEIEGHRVVGIDKGAFEDNKNLVAITVDGLNIPGKAFEDCKKLETVVLKNVTEIGDYAFSGCSSLEEITITEGKAGQTLTVGKRAFSDCRSLESVEINQTLIYGESHDYFYKSTGVKTLKLKNFAYTAKDLNGTYVTKLAALFGEEGKESPSVKLEELTVEKMDAVPAGFVSGFKKLESVTVNGTEIKTVGNSAFEGCGALKTVSLKGKLVSIGDYAFAETDISSLDMSKVSTLGQGVFKDCDRLEKVTGLGAGGVDSIPKNTFEGCVSLKTFDFHKNIKHVFTEAFKGAGLTEISIPAGVTYDAGILKGCNKLATLEVYEFGSAGFIGQLFGAERDLNSDEMAGYISNALTTVTLGTGTEINESAFKGCKNVTTINLPANIVSIGANAFSGCKKLTVVDIPSDSQSLKSIGDRAFYKCEKLKYAPLLDSLERIGDGAFEGCNSLEAIALPFLGATPGADSDESVAYIFGGRIPASLKEIAVLDAGMVDIPDGAFEDCVGVKKITIPNNAVSIGASAFEGCVALTTVALSDGTSPKVGADLRNAETIGARAFYGCTALSTVELSQKTSIIGASAFEGTGLLKITIPASVTYIGEGILSSCTKLGAAELPYLGATSTENGRLGYFFGDIIPSSLTTVKVEHFEGNTIGADAFNGADGITSVILPNGIVEIGEGAFKGCASLNGFSFAEVESVGDEAFFGCTSLKSIDLSRVVTVGDEAFYGCKGITRVSLDCAKAIGDGAFEGCTSLSTVTLGQELKKIGKNAFCETGIKSIAIPEGITELSDYTFNKCSSLKDVALPSTLTHVYDGVFMDTALESISVPQGVSYIGAFAFKNSRLKFLSLPSYTDYIGFNIIEGVDTLERLELPLTWEMYGENVASYICGGNFPTTLKSITVNGCENNNIHTYAFAYSSDVEEIIIDAKVRAIYGGAFYYCTELRYISLPESLEELESDAFVGCLRLYEVTNPSGIYFDCDSVIYTSSVKAQTVEKDGYRYANYGDSWYLINYPDKGEITVNGIEGMVNEYIVAPYLFYDNQKIVNVTLGGNAVKIGARAFDSCYGLERVSLGNAVEHIEDGAFAYCGSLREVNLSEALKTVGAEAFYQCTALNGIKLYGKVSDIGSQAFYGCSSLYDVYNASGLNLVAGSRDYGYVARRAVAVHTNMNEDLSTEVTVDGIGVFRKSGNSWLLIRGVDQGTVKLCAFNYGGKTVGAYRIVENAFSYYYNLENLVVGNEVKQIQSNAFYDCDALLSVDLSANSSLKEIEEMTFASCNRLTDAKLPMSVSVIGDNAFYNCDRLERVEMPTALETIGYAAFCGCQRLISITLNSSVKEIGEDAFGECSFLLEVYDLSPHITVRAGSKNNGNVALNAVAVYTTADGGLERLEKDGFKLIRGGDTWYLYDFEDTGKKVVEIPRAGDNIVIIPYSVENGTFEGIVIPTSLREVMYCGILNCPAFEAIYYMGDASQWYSISGVSEFAGFQSVYYKADCVHYNSSGAWTYDEKGQVTTEACPETVKETREATCYENGLVVYNCGCEGCDYERREAIDRLSHEFTGDICKNCGETRQDIDKESLSGYVDRGIITTESFSFDEKGGRFVSSNKESGSVSYISVEAKGRMTLIFTVEASCLKGSDFVCVYENGVKSEMISGRESVTLTLYLDEGDTVVISYEKGYEGSQNGDCGYVKSMQIVEMKEQQSN